MGVHRFTDLRAWQACVVFKRAINELCESGPISRDFERRKQLEESAGRPAGHIAEGYGRFSPPDFARFTVIARSSLMEAQRAARASAASRHAKSARPSERRTTRTRRTAKPNPEPNLNLNPNREVRTLKSERRFT
jgi:four helix bundle protein